MDVQQRVVDCPRDEVLRFGLYTSYDTKHGKDLVAEDPTECPDSPMIEV